MQQIMSTVPVWCVILIIVMSVVSVAIAVSIRSIKDLEFDDADFRKQLAEMYQDQPEILEHLDDPIVEPEGYTRRPSHYDELLSVADDGSHRHLLASRREDRRVIRTCSAEALYFMSFAEIASLYGTTEDELILFLNARCPKILHKRIYYNSFCGR